MTGIEREIHRQLAGARAASPDARGIARLVRAKDPLRPQAQVDASVAEVQSHLTGLGPLDPLLADEAVSDVMVNGPGRVWVERAGSLIETDVDLTLGQVELLVERIVGPLGRRADPRHPLVDARLPDGSRVHVAVPPLAVDGPCITIRRFAARAVAVGAFTPSPGVADLLRWAVRARCNIVVSGATGSGKTTLLGALAAEIEANERVITVEDAAELRLAAPHVVRLESQVSGVDGGAEVTIRDLVRNALRMRPDRLIIGELRGPEALDLLTAMNTGHDGSLSTVHANSARDSLARLETLVLMAGVGLPVDAIRQQLASAIDLIVHVERQAQGRRAIAEVIEVGGRVLVDRSGIVQAPTCAGRSVGAAA